LVDWLNWLTGAGGQQLSELVIPLQISLPQKRASANTLSIYFYFTLLLIY